MYWALFPELALWIDDAHSIYGFFLTTQANIVLGLPEF
ncbi:hypothetical protein APHWI1_1274 [Anaplasma phagocytophilum str. ApWI1]|uniref:Uncharacterized protein n=1 Tax=Anaplasma phagocytophilum str. ApWI1 TaxID=1359155 RepID=A0A0F3PYQ9_ANAPH|nr:hypothetical protein APHWEB_0247 [Anaplasma phagocytophilum str. Webster]KJV84344.1 hypothetical protein APHWI1_1274 [Anaplasma phagocytophilum str. ApWI1]